MDIISRKKYVQMCSRKKNPFAVNTEKNSVQNECYSILIVNTKSFDFILLTPRSFY